MLIDRKVHRIAALLIAGLLAAGIALAAKPDAYQVTGTVEDVNATVITVMKGKERFEIARDGATKMPADVKKGDRVTVYYRMTATEVEAKAAKGATTKASARKK